MCALFSCPMTVTGTMFVGMCVILNEEVTSKGYRKAATDGFPMAPSTPYVVEFGSIRFPTEASWSCQIFPTM